MAASSGCLGLKRFFEQRCLPIPMGAQPRKGRRRSGNYLNTPRPSRRTRVFPPRRKTTRSREKRRFFAWSGLDDRARTFSCTTVTVLTLPCTDFIRGQKTDVAPDRRFPPIKAAWGRGRDSSRVCRARARSPEPCRRRGRGCSATDEASPGRWRQGSPRACSRELAKIGIAVTGETKASTVRVPSAAARR